MTTRRASVVLFAVLCVALPLSVAEAQEASLAIRLNTVGYLPDSLKRASIAAECSQFAVVRAATDETVLAGAVTGPVLNEDTQEQLCTADFSAVTEPGEYALVVPGVGRSAAFRVGADVYDEPFRVVMLGMYLWRCGTAVRTEYNGNVFGHEACHMQDAWMDFVTGEHEQRDGTGGWHDAGDYNKYVTNAAITVGPMQMAWDDFGPAVDAIALPIPESGGPIPDPLAEIKWELDWFLKMQAPDGRVLHKLSTQNFGGFIMPEDETTERYFTPWSSGATADFAAVMAVAARQYRPYDAAYADKCLAAALNAYRFLAANPGDHRADLSGFRTGTYQVRDPASRMWAAVALWETTGDDRMREDFEGRARALLERDRRVWDDGGRSSMALLSYLKSTRPGRDEALLGQIRDGLIDAADAIVATRNAHGYARPYGTRYFWGCNDAVSRQTVLLQAAYQMDAKPEYRETALDALNHLFGRNYFGRSFVTGLGYMPPMHPHDRRSGGDDVVDPWPGYVIGGAERGATNWQDIQDDYRTNEIAINWNGALIYALAGFVSGAGQ
jgi:endoglucanase